MSNHYKLTIEYDGTNFCGWQVQPNKRTVQSELESALFSFYQEKIRVTASGRTDAGVHALGQVISYSTQKNRTDKQIRFGLNSFLPNDITVKKVESVSNDFNPRYDAIRRYYFYQIYQDTSALYRRTAWCILDQLNVLEMKKCANLIVGEHDFQSFCSSKAEVNQFRCTVEKAAWAYEKPQMLVFTIIANRFLHNMVRILVGTIVEVGRGRFTVEDLKKMLFNKNRQKAGLTAPACGLFLEKVEY